ncbi:MAG: hypothetical protein P1U56_13145 [Saprospiraceae bacterium]|nr:hypothetical protein [Saprospiraceae bacterium]
MKKQLITYTFLLFTASLTFYSCTDEVEFQINDSDITYLKTFIEEADEIAQFYDELEGPKGSEIFGDYKNAVCGNEHDFIGPCIWAIDDIIEAIGYQDIERVHKWMLDAGEILIHIKKRNEGYENQAELLTEVACAIDPEILTRNADKLCYKDNLVALLSGALDGASSHSTNYVNSSSLKKEDLYLIGSSFYKVWRYMINTKNCN